MRLAISNIAWDINEDEAIANLLHRFGIDAIDISPGKYFPDPVNTTDTEIALIKNWWFERSIEVTGMQALLFGTIGLNIFGGDESQDRMLRHLEAICRIGAGLGAKQLVFGSPKNRDRIGLTDQETIDIAVSFFRRLGDIAQNYEVFICLEPNPLCYGANFMINSTEVVQIVQAVNHYAIKMQFDTGTLTINDEDPLQLLENSWPLIGHVHISEPNLLPLGDGGTNHNRMFAALKQYLPSQLISIEMLATKNEPHEVSIHRALNVAIQHYRTA